MSDRMDKTFFAFVMISFILATKARSIQRRDSQSEIASFRNLPDVQDTETDHAAQYTKTEDGSLDDETIDNFDTFAYSNDGVLLERAQRNHEFDAELKEKQDAVDKITGKVVEYREENEKYPKYIKALDNSSDETERSLPNLKEETKEDNIQRAHEYKRSGFWWDTDTMND